MKPLSFYKQFFRQDEETNYGMDNSSICRSAQFVVFFRTKITFFSFKIFAHHPEMTRKTRELKTGVDCSPTVVDEMWRQDGNVQMLPVSKQHACHHRPPRDVISWRHRDVLPSISNVNHDVGYDQRTFANDIERKLDQKKNEKIFVNREWICLRLRS